MTPTILAVAIVWASGVGLSPDFPASYQIECRLDTSSHKLVGTERITFVSPALEPINRICFHLYPNAFTDTATVFCRENGRIRSDVESGNISHLAVSNTAVNDAAVAESSVSVNGTLLTVDLAAPLPPGGRVDLSLDFDLLIPRARVRFGYDEAGNYLLSHCLPILCGYQKGRLVDWEYHSNSEFFSNFSSYDVIIETPAGFEVGATGRLGLVGKDSTVARWRAVADTVIDFAIACGPAFQVLESDTLGIHLRYLLRKSHVRQFDAADKMVRQSLAYYSGHFFPYPYGDFTLVDFDAGTSGMELPQMAVIAFPEARNGSVGRTILNLAIAHEVAHEWFYAAVASNEFEEPWLDEGLSSYITSKMLAKTSPEIREFNILGYRFSYDILERFVAVAAKAEWPIDLKSWQYPDFFSYNIAVYDRAALAFKTLGGILGPERFDAILRDFADAYRFKHPDGTDFLSYVADRAGVNLERFYSQFIEGTSRVDYSVKSIEFKPTAGQDSALQKEYKIDVTVGRELDGILPQRLLVGLENGSTIDTSWDGSSRVASFTFVADSRPLYAAIDTARAYPLDENFTNNSLYIKPFGTRLISFEWDLVAIKEFLLSLSL